MKERQKQNATDGHTEKKDLLGDAAIVPWFPDGEIISE
jgi:hypothetical protein